MKIYTSYFWNIRNLPKNCIPISTALSDPAYFHDFRGKQYQFIDKRGVYNGLRCELLNPGAQLSGLCVGACEIPNSDCRFLTGYKKQLDEINFDDFMRRLKDLCTKVGKFLGIEDEAIAVLLVHEVPSNPCSERGPIQEWFKEHGVEVEEYPVPEKRSGKPKRQEIFDF